MKEKLSALVDNELDELETRRLLTALAADEALRATWGRYHLIGAMLRRESVTPVEVAARVLIGGLEYLPFVLLLCWERWRPEIPALPAARLGLVREIP